MMYDTKKVYIGRFWFFNPISNEYHPIDDYSRIFFLIKHKFRYSYRPDFAFKDILFSEKYYSKDLSKIITDPFFVPLDKALSLEKAFPNIKFPSKLSKSQLLQIYKLFYEVQCKMYNEKSNQQEIETTTEDVIKTKVLNQKRK